MNLFANQQFGIILRYVASGGAAACVHFGILILLVESLTFNPTIASAIGFIAAIFVNYSLQYHWTFDIKAPNLHRVFFIRYLLVTLITLVINTILFWVMNEVIELQYIYAQIIATGVVLIINFLVNQNYTFKHSSALQSS